MDKKLYKVTLTGMQSTNSSGIIYGISYVVAENSHEAYLKVRSFLDKEDLSFAKERELANVELIADSDRYTNVKHMLFL